jgi:5-methylcytosine-specific restriction endonuclease McrA
VVSSKCIVCGKLVRKGGSVPAKYCSLECKAEKQRQAKPVTKEWLYRKYVVEGLDCTQIAGMVDRDPKSVWNWLKDLGIPRRPRGTNSTNWIKPGSPGTFLGRKHSPESIQKMKDVAIAQGRVPYHPEVGPYLKGKRGAETTNWKGGVTPERQAFYATPEWKQAVKDVWQRDDAKCVRCGLDHRTVDRSVVKFDIHHIVSFSVKELRCELSNLVLLCEECHYFVHSRENVNREFLG